MARRSDDHVILSEEDLMLLDILRAGPVFDFELSKRFGENYSSMLRDLRTNDHPVHSTSACSESHPCARIHYHEKPGSELTLCIKCKERRRTIGPFCSHDCQLVWEQDRLSQLSGRDILSETEKERRSAKIPARYRETPEAAYSFTKVTRATRSASTERLCTAIQPHIVWHLAKKAAIRGSIQRHQMATMIRVGNQLYNGVQVSEGDMRELDLALAQCLDSGIIEAECHENNCGMCRKLTRDLDYLKELRHRMRSAPRAERKSFITHETMRHESRVEKFVRGPSPFPPLPPQEESTGRAVRKKWWIFRKWR